MNPTITAQRTCETKHNLVVRRRNQWGAKRSYTDENPITHPASYLFLHISVTNPSAYTSNDRHAQAIEGIGISRFPNTGMSYNMLVMPNGAIYEGQPVGRRGAHTVNDFGRRTCSTTGCPSKGSSLGSTNNLNYNARSVVLCQNVGNTVTTAQVQAVARIGSTWKRCGYATRSAKWHGHRCVSAKSCPGDRGFNRLDEVAALTEKYYTSSSTEGDDDVTAEDVWQKDGIVDAPPGSSTIKTNKFWRAGYTLTRMAQEILYDFPKEFKAIRLALTSPITRTGMVAGDMRQLLSRLEVRSVAGKAETAKLQETTAAILASVSGANTAEIIAKIDAHHAEVMAKVEAEEARDAEMLEMVQNVQRGELAVDDLLDALTARLTKGAPEEVTPAPE